MTELVAILIFLIPLFLAIIFARRFNIVQGFVTFIFVVYVIMFLGYEFNNGTALIENLHSYLVVGSYDLLKPFELIFNFINKYTFDLIPGIADASWAKYVYVGGMLVIFVIVLLISIKISKAKKEKLRKLKRLAGRKVY